MKLTKQKLKEIIIEELKKQKSELDKVRDNTEKKRNQRQRDFFRYGGEELRQLAKGIAEDNPYRDENGHFTSKDDAATYSTYFIDRVRKNLKGPTRSVDDSGRGRTRAGKGKFKLKNGEKNYEESLRPVEMGDEMFCLTLEQLRSLLENVCEDFYNKFASYKNSIGVIGEEGQPIDWDRECRKRKFQTFSDYLNAVDKVKRAEDGRLHSKPK